MIETYKRILSRAYGLAVLSIQAVPGGWSASAWRVQTSRGDYFLKVYDKNKLSTKSWVERIDRYMPAVLWLHENTGLRENMSAPVFTLDGSYKWEDADRLYIVFPFINGPTVCETKLEREQVRSLAQIVAELHRYGAEIPIRTDGLREDFDVSFCDALNRWLHSSQLAETLAPYRDIIRRSIEKLGKAAKTLRESEMQYVLCHTDIDGWNLVQSERLILVDWEGLKLAPVEADLFSFTDTFFFPYAWENFIAVYRSVHQDYQVNPAAMRFYRLRRRLEDIHAFAQSFLFDNLAREAKDRELEYLIRECSLLSIT